MSYFVYSAFYVYYTYAYPNWELNILHLSCSTVGHVTPTKHKQNIKRNYNKFVVVEIISALVFKVLHQRVYTSGVSGTHRGLGVTDCIYKLKVTCTVQVRMVHCFNFCVLCDGNL